MTRTQSRRSSLENTSSAHSSSSPHPPEILHAPVDAKPSFLSSTLRDIQAPPDFTIIPPKAQTQHFYDEGLQAATKAYTLSPSSRKDQEHLLDYGQADNDSDSSLASSFQSESGIESPDVYMYGPTLDDPPNSLISSSATELKVSKPQGRSHRLSRQPEFHRLQVPTPGNKRSLLHEKLVQSGLEQNVDLLGQYTCWGSTEGEHGMRVRLYFPGQVDPTTGRDVAPLSLLVRRDASMENLVGFGLLSFIRTYGRYPTHPDTDSPASRMATDAWSLRIVEDGCVDDDYPSMSCVCLPQLSTSTSPWASLAKMSLPFVRSSIHVCAGTAH